MNTQDIFAGLAALICLIGIIIISLSESEVPAELTAFAGLAAGWLFRGQITPRVNGAINGVRTR